MPFFKKRPFNRRPYRRRAYRKKKVIRYNPVVPRTAPGSTIGRPKIYKFKRDLEQTLILDAVSPPEGWDATGNRIYTQLGWALGSLGDITDFQSLFTSYKIHGARVRMYFSMTGTNTSVDSNTGPTSYYDNSQLLVRTCTDQAASVKTLNDAFWTARQAKKYKLCLNNQARPLDFYIPLTMLNEVPSSTATAVSQTKPQWLRTVESNVVHYGQSLSIERVDGQAFGAHTAGHQVCKVITTLYMSFKGTE